MDHLIEHRRDGSECWSLDHPTRLADQGPNHPPLKRQGQGEQSVPINRHCPLGVFTYHLNQVLRDPMLQTEILFTKDFGLSSQHLQQGRIEPSERWQEFVTNTVSQVEQFRIARVFPKFQSLRLQISDNISSAEVQQRTDELRPPGGRDPGEPRRSGPAQHPHEERLSLVIGRMTQRDLVRATSLTDSLHSRISCLARIFLEGLSRSATSRTGHVDPLVDQLHTKPFTKPGDEAGVFLGFRAAQAVIDMDRPQDQRPGLGQLCQQGQERDRVRSARDGGQKAIPPTEQPSRSCSLGHAPRKR